MGLKQAILADGLALVLVLVVGVRGMRSRVVRASECDRVGVRGVARVKGSRREVSKKGGCIAMEFGRGCPKRRIGQFREIEHTKEELPYCYSRLEQ